MGYYLPLVEMAGSIRFCDFSFGAFKQVKGQRGAWECSASFPTSCQPDTWIWSSVGLNFQSFRHPDRRYRLRQLLYQRSLMHARWMGKGHLCTSLKACLFTYNYIVQLMGKNGGRSVQILCIVGPLRIKRKVFLAAVYVVLRGRCRWINCCLELDEPFRRKI